MRRTVWIACLGAALALAVAEPAAAARSDAWITTKTKLALLTAENVSGSAINVDTIDGRVTLHGKVASEAEKAKAEQVARGIEGTREVRNLLQVVAPKREEGVEASDAEIKERVGRALRDNRSLADSTISVESVNDGVVLLSGDAHDLEDHLTAVSTARQVPGVRRVASEVKSPDALADAEVRREERREPQAAAREGDGRTTGGTASDMWITSATKLRLMANTDTPALSINVDTRDGVVTLFGMVPSDAAKAAAETEARKVSGVKQVRNELQVVPEQRQEAVQAKDDDIERAIEQAFDQRPSLKDANVTVEVEDGVARLSGTVPSSEDRVSAAVAARSTRGVRAVLQDELRVAPARGTDARPERGENDQPGARAKE